MTTPKEKREEKGVDFDGGEAGNNENALKMASKIQEDTQWINVRKIGKLNPTLPITCNHPKKKN